MRRRGGRGQATRAGHEAGAGRRGLVGTPSQRSNPHRAPSNSTLRLARQPGEMRDPNGECMRAEGEKKAHHSERRAASQLHRLAATARRAKGGSGRRDAGVEATRGGGRRNRKKETAKSARTDEREDRQRKGEGASDPPFCPSMPPPHHTVRTSTIVVAPISRQVRGRS